MKKNNQEIEKYRLTRDKAISLKEAYFASDSGYGNNGVFEIPYKNVKLFCVVSDQMDWDHISIHVLHSKKPRCPFWGEMCFIKNLFWDESETVIQFHPKKSEYINCHPITLHLWKYQKEEFILPPKYMV